MRKSNMVERCERRLVELGCPASQVHRMINEISDHHDDLERAALKAGLSGIEAEAQADARIGEPVALAEKLVAELRQSTFCGRHPVVSCCILAPLGIIAVMAFGFAQLWLLWNLCLPHNLQAAFGAGGSGLKVVALLVKSVYYASILATAVLFWWLVRKSGLGIKWVLVACGACSLLGLFLHLTILPHSFIVGIGFARDWPSVALPLVVAATACVWQQRMRDRLRLCSGQALRTRMNWLVAMLSAGALLLLSMGCAARQSSPVLQRGWVGGEYKVARDQAGPFSSEIVCAFPATLRETQRAGILITGLSSNAPARLAGLCEGDLILELDHHPVTELQDFRLTIDRSRPGSVLTVKARRDGQPIECVVPVGRECFQKWGSITLGLFAHPWDLWPNPGFSLVFLGYEQGGSRHELGSVETTYARSCDPTGYRVVDEDWSTWLVLLQLSSQKVILAQEAAAPKH